MTKLQRYVNHYVMLFVYVYVKRYTFPNLPCHKRYKTMRLTSHRGAIAALALLCSAFNPQARADESEIAVVVKIGGIPWFTAMEQGIKKAGESFALSKSW